ncbi:MHYT domain-containing protein [Actinoplanes sp. NPDC048967]|uniref:MHYT domain-containing protein n=1 Tax=Actinoplanes sp. NPDC048967 TaxID=3155269 RepID=UPI00340D9198
MAEVHHFTYGAFNPIAAYLVAFLGSFLGLLATGRARSARSRSRRNRWLVIAAFSIGGAGIWLMHFTAMLGFDVPQSPVRYNPWLTMVSLGLAVVTVGLGLMVVGHGRRSLPKIAVAGFFTGIGVLAMHYTGMAGLHVSGKIHFNPALVAASAIIAVVACAAALWFAVSVKGMSAMTGAAALMGMAVAGMHYTGMASMSVELSPTVSTDVHGIKPLLMIVPITLVSAALILGVALSALQAMTDEEFTFGEDVPRRGMHAENPWSLKQASMSAMRRAPGSRPSPGTRPSPRPVPLRPKPLIDEPLIDVPS